MVKYQNARKKCSVCNGAINRKEKQEELYKFLCVNCEEIANTIKYD